MAYPQDKGQKDKVLNTGRIAYVGDGTNFFPLRANSAGQLILGYDLIEHLEHPFGKGSLTTDGVQYTAETTGITNSAYVAVPAAATLTLPTGATLVEVEFGLTAAIKSSGSTETMLWKAQASDDNTNWEDLIGEQTAASGSGITSYADKTCNGRFAPTGNFAGSTIPFYTRMVAKAGGATFTLSAKMKNSSYINVIYKMW